MKTCLHTLSSSGWKIPGRPLAMMAALLMASPVFADAIPDGGHHFIPTVKEADLYQSLRNHALQKRVQMVLDPRLCAAARKHAADLQARRYFAHRNPDGVDANQRALDAGYPLPPNYDPEQNFIESIAGSTADKAADVVARWKKSPAHATHVFGKHEFYRGQVVIGIGHAPRSGLGYATYVFLSAPLPEGPDVRVATPAGGFMPVGPTDSGILEIHGLPEGSIFEIWIKRQVTKKKTRSVPDRLVVVDASGVLPLGAPLSPPESYELGHLVP